MLNEAVARVLREDPPNAEAAPTAFAYLVTPADQRFVRCHYPVPAIGAEHTVEISGALARPAKLSLPALRSLPQETHTVVTECAGNGRARLDPPAPGEQWGDGAISTAQWTGVPLKTLLDEAGVKDTVVELVFTGADGGEFQRSLPREIANDALVALQMNGAGIPDRFGGPVRLIVPGWYGVASVKWLSRIEAVEKPFTGKYQTEKYLYGPGTPVTRMLVKSMFTSIPQLMKARLPARLEGLAWGGNRIERVEVSCGGAWREASLVGPALPHAWRRFRFRWTPPAPGEYVLRCRATDERGETQPEQSIRNPHGYGLNGTQRVPVRVD